MQDHRSTTAPPRKKPLLPSRADLRRDVPASLVVFLVALPLSLGIAVASGAPVMAGLIAAAVGGIVAGSLGGSPLQVSGPAAGLTVIVAGLIEQFGWPATCAITVAAGCLQILLGLSRVGRAALAISPVVVHAMLAGIGITIVLQQLHVVLGSTPGSNATENIGSLPASLAAVNPPALILGSTVIVLLLVWKKLPRTLQQIPGQLVAVVLVTVLSLAWGGSVERISLDGSLLQAISAPVLPSGAWGAVGIGVLTMALIASVESLLSAVAVDKMQFGPRTNFNRELVGQGAANVTSGMLGGLPVTGVIVRSATNVEAGGRTRASAVLHGVWILLFSVFLASVLMMIPQAVLAGLLVVIGVQLVKFAHIKSALRTGDFRSAASSGLAPWKSWQARTATGGPVGRPETLPVLQGVENYLQRHAALVRDDTEALAGGQDPTTLFLTCVDSRVVPNVITSSGPGDLLTVRNVGNAVDRTGSDLSFEAALEFAVDTLDVSTITVCGHSNCGAMQALLTADPPPAGDAGAHPVETWLGGLRASRTALDSDHPVLRDAVEAGYCTVDQLALVNIAVQLETLAAHPRLRHRVESGSLHLVGLFYDLSTANVIHLSATGIHRLEPAL